MDVNYRQPKGTKGTKDRQLLFSLHPVGLPHCQPSPIIDNYNDALQSLYDNNKEVK
jgi:hypothetical protein